MSSRILLQGVGTTDDFPFESGGKQGGIETPEVFNFMIEFALEAVDASWKRRGFGFSFKDFDDSNIIHPALTHLIWADNIIFFASSTCHFRTMAQDLTKAVYEIRFRWKFESLECMLCGLSVDGAAENSFIEAGGTVRFTVKRRMALLGTMFDQRGDTEESMEYRLTKAEGCFWKHFKTFHGPGAINNKLQAWLAAPGSSALYGCGNWHFQNTF